MTVYEYQKASYPDLATHARAMDISEGLRAESMSYSDAVQAELNSIASAGLLSAVETLFTTREGLMTLFAMGAVASSLVKPDAAHAQQYFDVAHHFGATADIANSTFVDKPDLSRAFETAIAANPGEWSVVNAQVNFAPTVDRGPGVMGSDRDSDAKIMSFAIGPKGQVVWMADEIGPGKLGMIDDPQRFIEKNRPFMVPLFATPDSTATSMKLVPSGGTEPIMGVDVGVGDDGKQVITIKIIDPDSTNGEDCLVSGFNNASFKRAPEPTASAIDLKPTLAPTEAAPVIEVANMASLDIEKIFEKGAVNAVQNVFTEGKGNFEVLDVKLPLEGQAIDYLTFSYLDGPTIRADGFTVNTASVSGLTVLRMALLHGDLQNNSKTSDGDLTALEIATKIKGQNVKFVLLLTGNLFENKKTDLIFKNFKPGQVIKDLAITYIPESGVTTDMKQANLANNVNFSPEKFAEWRFTNLRNGGAGMSMNSIIELMVSGRVITTNEIVVNGIE